MAIGESAGLLFKIKGDSSDAIAAIKSVDTASDKLAGTTSTLASSFGSMINPATIAIGAVTAIGTAAVAVGLKFFDLSKQAADFGSEIFDATQKTGLGAEQISALKFAAEQAGSSFEQVTKGVSVFGITLGDAAQGSDKAREKLANLKVTSTDLDEGLRQVFRTIADAKSPTEQLSLATQAFGKKIGPDLIPLIKDANGNFDELIDRAKKAGVTIGDEAAAQADAFGDQMDLLNTQLAGVARTIGFSVMPIFLEWATRLSDWLAQNKQQIESWANRFAKSIEFVAASIVNNIDAFAGLAQILVAIFNQDWNQAAAGVERITKALQSQQGAFKDLTTNRKDGAVRDAGGRPRSGELLIDDEQSDAESRRKAREDAFKKELANRDRNIQLQLQQARAAYDETVKFQEEAFLKREKSEEEFIQDSISNINAYKETVINLLREAYQIDLKQAATDTERENARLKGNLALQALNKEINREGKEAAELVKRQNKEIDAEKQKTWEQEREHYDWLVQMEIYIKGLVFDRLEEQRKFLESFPNASNLILPSTEGPDAQSEGIFDQWTESWERFFNTVSETAPTLRSILGDVAGFLQNAFQGMANAIGNVVQQWVLYGKTGPAIMRQILAQALASIAAEAAVRAIFELAKGFAALFLNPAEAASHFTAAALFGSIAVGAGLAGRAVAGNSFNQQSLAAGGGSGSGSEAQNAQNNPLQFTERFNGFQQRMNEMLDRTATVLGGVAESIDGFTNKFAAVSPGHVVMAGAGDASQEIRAAFETELGTDLRAATNFFRQTGQYR